MTTPTSPNIYKHHRFPGEIISHAVWLYCHFPLSHRDVEELLFARRVIVSYEAIRKWCRKFVEAYANQLRRRRPWPGDKWHLDEVFITINKERYYLWRVVDQDGVVLDILVQRRRNKQAAKKFFRKLLKGCQYVPRGIITVLEQPCRELAPTRPPVGAAHAGVQSPRACPMVSRRVWAYRPTLSTTPTSLIRACISSRDEAKMPDLG